MTAWVCTTCGNQAAESRLTATVVPRMRLGRCSCSPGTRHFVPREVPDQPVPGPIPLVIQPTGGLARKAAGMIRVTAAVRDGVDEAWRQVARDAALRLIAEGDAFTADDIVARAGLPQHRNAVGALLSGLARSGRIVPAGYIPGERPEQHARIIRVWRRA